MLRGTSSPSTRLLDQLISSANNRKYSTLCLSTVLKSLPGIESLEVFNDWEAADEAESRSKAATKVCCHVPVWQSNSNFGAAGKCRNFDMFLACLDSNGSGTLLRTDPTALFRILILQKRRRSCTASKFVDRVATK